MAFLPPARAPARPKPALFHEGRCQVRQSVDGSIMRLRAAAHLNRLTPAAGNLSGAGDETRTRDPLLGKQMLYRLSYSRPALQP